MKYVTAAAVLAAATLSAHAGAAQELNYWVFSDFAQGEAGKLQQTFIDEFEAEHPGVTINLIGKGDADLLTGEIAGAISGTGPDVFMNSTSVGAALVRAHALANVYDEWMAMPEDFRSQFDPDLIDMCTPAPETMYCLPYTGYASLMYRNLTVLKDAGINPSAGVTDWDDWITQAKKIGDAGKFAVPDMSQAWSSWLPLYAGIADRGEWGADFSTNKTLLNPDKYTATLDLLKSLQPYSTGTDVNDQATTDLFMSGQLAYYISGPWKNPTFEAAAAKSGLDYDWVPVPGAQAGETGGMGGYEFIGVKPGENEKISWEFAAYVADKQEMIRWAAELGRFNSNIAALDDPSVAKDPLIEFTKKYAPGTLLNRPPFFQKVYPNDYFSAITANLQATLDGNIPMDQAAPNLVKQLNDILSDL